jgi:hypothetical protein
MKYIDSKTWGPWGWYILHIYAYNKNIKLNKKYCLMYYKFYELFGKLIPCPLCQNHYNSIFNLKKEFDREYLINWSYEFHNKVNKDLEKDILFSYNDFINKYNDINIDKNIIYNYLDLLFLPLNNDISIIELNNYIYFLKIIITLYPENNLRLKYLKQINDINEISNTYELKKIYNTIKNIK